MLREDTHKRGDGPGMKLQSVTAGGKGLRMSSSLVPRTDHWSRRLGGGVGLTWEGQCGRWEEKQPFPPSDTFGNTVMGTISFLL